MHRMEGLPIGATVVFDLAKRETPDGGSPSESVQAVNVRLKKEKINANVLLRQNSQSPAVSA
jgi:hypothetical protein